MLVCTPISPKQPSMIKNNHFQPTNPRFLLMISNKSNVDMIFMQYKTTTCLSIDEVLKKNKEIPTTNVEPKEKKC